jgi:hypothetical protein
MCKPFSRQDLEQQVKWDEKTALRLSTPIFQRIKGLAARKEMQFDAR